MLKNLMMAILLMVSMAFGSDWPQWRGPNFNGSSDETNLPASLDPNTLLWKTPLPGPGEATPAVCSGRVYLSGYEPKNKTLFALCLDADTGKMRWNNTASTFEKLPQRNIIASPSPVADKTGAVFLYSEGTLVKFDPDGKPLWKRNLVADYGPLLVGGWSYSGSPLLHDGRIYVGVMRKPQPTAESGYTGPTTPYLLAINPADGTTLFKTDRPSDAGGDSNDSYTTPIIVQVNGRSQILMFGADYLTGHDPQTGREMWRYRYMDEEMPWGRTVATPIADGNMLYCAFPVGSKSFACDLSKLAANEPPRVWTYGQPGSDVPSPALYKGCLYMIEEREKKLICLEAKTGRLLWTGDLNKDDMYYASLTAADDKLYMVNRKGVVTIAAADPAQFRILHTQDMGESPVDSTPVIANGKLYIRTAEHLYCFGKK